MTSVSNASEPSATDNARTPLHDLIARAAAADQDIVTSQRNRALIRDMAVALVAQAKLIVDYQQQLDDRRIVIPG